MDLENKNICSNNLTEEENNKNKIFIIYNFKKIFYSY